MTENTITDIDTLDRFLDHLHRGGKVAHWWCYENKASIWFDVNDRRPYPSSWDKSNVYFSIHPCTQIPDNGKETKQANYRKSRLEFIAAVNCFFAEFDAKVYGDKESMFAHLWDLPIYPSVVINSGGGLHCYWLLSSTVSIDDANREYIKDLQYAWVDLVGGDDDSKDLPRVLRPVGSQNRKPKYAPNYPTISFVECDFERLYTLEDIERLTWDIRKKQPQKSEKKKAPRPAGTTTTEDLITAVACLKRLAPGRNDKYGDWLKVGMILHTLGDTGLQLWDDWSQQSAEYDPGACDIKWETFDDDRGLNLGTLVHWANEDDPAGNPRQNSGGVDAMAYAGYGPAPAISLNGHSSATATASGDDAPAGAPPQATTLDMVVQALGIAATLPSFADQLSAIRHLMPIIGALSDDDCKTIELPLLSIFKTMKSVNGFIADCKSIGRQTGETGKLLQELYAAGYKFRMNELDDSIEVNGALISDGIASEIRCKMRDRKLRGMDAIKDAYTMNAYHNRYHPIKDFLDGLTWDGKDHLAELARHFTDTNEKIFHPDGTESGVFYTFIKRWAIGAVAKVYEHAQNITLTLAGPQGIGKSYVAQWLCSPIADYFNEGQLDPDGKETDRRLARTWIWEIGELGATTRRSDVNALKNKLTQSHVTFRVPYGHYDVTKPVLTSFIGTVNPDGHGFLVDRTGNRRFAVVDIAAIDHSYSAAMDASQVWAQAVALYRAGEPWRLLPEERTTQTQINETHQAELTIDIVMPELFVTDPTKTDDKLMQMEPFKIANELFFKNYGPLDKCAKDAAAWLKTHGHVKKGKPPTWRGIRLKNPGETLGVDSK